MSAEVAQLEVLSWNLFGSPVARNAEARMRRVARWAAKRRFDLMLFQEVWTAGQADAIRAVLAERYEINLSGPARAIVGRQGGLMALVRRDSLWRCTGTDFSEFLAEAPDALVWQGDGVSDKGVQRLRLRHTEARLEVVVLNTHLQSDYSPRALFTYDGVRARQLREIEAIARQDAARPLLAFGDFNLAPTSANYRSLRKFWTLELSEAARAACACGSHNGVVEGAAAWIDYAFARPTDAWRIEAGVTRLERSDEVGMLSDHNGLTVSIHIRRAAEAALDALATAALAGPSTRRTWLAGATWLLARSISGRLGS